MVNDRDRSPAVVEAEAAAWLARLNGPYRSVDTETALRKWLQVDPSHENAFERVTDIWELLPSVSGSAEKPVKYPRQREAAPRPRVFIAVVAVAALVSIEGGYIWFNRPPVFATEVGEQELVSLDDGTHVALNTDSRITALYSKQERRVLFDHGEAMFDVTKDLSRPFIVVAGDEQVRALGTSFIVRREDGELQVTLLKGRVEISRPDKQRIERIATLAPGQRITVKPHAGAALDQPSIEAVTAWRRGEVVFEDTTLLEVAEELNRYGKHHLVIADPSLGSLKISGVFSTNDVVEVAEAIAVLHHLRVQRDEADLRLTRSGQPI